MPDFAKVQRNVTKMIDAGAPERDIDLYLRTEKTNPAQLRAYGKRAKDYGATDLVASKYTFGLADKVGAVGDAIGGEIRERVTGGPDVSFGDRYDTALGAERGAKDAYKEANPGVDWATSPLNFLAGAPAKTGMAAIKAARVAGGVGGGAQAYANSDGSPLEQAGQTAAGVVVGATLGDLAARYVPRAVNTLANAVRPTAQKIGQRLRPHTEAVQTGVEGAADANIDPRAAGRAVLQAAQRQGINLLPADVGGPITRRLTGATAQTLGAGPIVRGAQQTAATAGMARDRMATQAGSVADSTGAGQAVQRGAKAFMDRTKKTGGDLYEAIPIDAKADSALDNTRSALADLTAGFESNPELSKMFSNPRLKGYLDALTPKPVAVTQHVVGGGQTAAKIEQAGGKLSWPDLKRFRSIIGDMAGEARFSDDTTRKQVQALYGALSKDMEATAAAQGPKALQAFRRANNYWHGREKRIDTVLGPILGETKDKGAAAVFEGIERLANAKGGDAMMLGRALRTMPVDEAATVRATVIDRLGRARPSAQDPQGSLFSPETFLTQWNNMSPRAKSVLFHDPALRSSLDDLARVAFSVRETNQFANRSQTGGAVNIVGLGLLGAGTGGIGSLQVAGLQYATGKLLASPKFVQWLVRVPKVKGPGVAQAARSHVGQLSAIAAREPTIRNEVLALQQRLQEALSKPPQRLAAEEEPDNVRREPPAQRQQ